ncbi:MAG: deoxycytidylate deaminase, partial [Eubacterium sp.]
QLGGCLREKLHVPSGQRHELCRALHAEQNAIIQAATLGQSIEGGTIYITNSPCSICAKMIINAGLTRIVVRDGYPDELAKEILDEAEMDLEYLPHPDKAEEDAGKTEEVKQDADH